MPEVRGGHAGRPGWALRRMQQVCDLTENSELSGQQGCPLVREVTSPPGWLTANTTLRNGPGEEQSGPAPWPIQQEVQECSASMPTDSLNMCAG